MFLFVVSLILLLLALGLFVAAKLAGSPIPAIIGGVLVLIGGFFLWNQSTYTQGPGSASVIKSFTGAVVGFNDKAGLSFKAPWDDTITYNILNQQVLFSNPNNVHDEQKNFVKGGEISITDKDGVSANVDIAVNLSIRGDKVVDIYNHYGDENSFEAKLVTNDVRAVVREVPNQFNTIDVLTNRSAIETQILKALQGRWETQGVQVDSVSLQDIRYPQSVTDAYAAAQNSRTAATKAQADLDAAKISAQQQVVSAQAQAQANDILSKSLTPEILQQRQLDVLSQFGAKGNAIVIQGGSGTPLIQVPSK
jgi:regulator of protease activity HflC (stomatin/prohibitin superfamily)